MIDCVAKGEAIKADWTGTLATDSVQLTEVNENVAAAGTQAAIDEAKAKLEAGTLKVFDTSTFTVKGETLSTYMADVNTDANFEGDTEAVADGEFKESNFRSAPYFDIDIDGILVIQ